MNRNEHVNKNIIAVAATMAYALVGLSITCLMMDKALKDLHKASKKIESFVDKHMVKKPTSAPDVKPECWGTGDDPNNGADDDKAQSDTITECFEKLNTEDSTPWDAPLE